MGWCWSSQGLCRDSLMRHLDVSHTTATPPHTCSPDYAQRFIDALPDARLVWVDECGHCAHLEQPGALVAAIAEFVGADAPAPAAAPAAT